MLISISWLQTLLWLGNLGLLVVFALAGITKLRDLNRASEGLMGFGVPERWAQPLAIALACAEIASAVLLAISPTQLLGAFGALALLAAFTLALMAQLLRGKRPTCACFGALSQAAISWKSVARNGLLMALAVGLIALPPLETLPFEAAVLPTLIAISWAALSTFWLLHLTRQNGRLLLRIEQLEQSTSNTLSTQTQPLQLGAALPTLHLNDAHGHLVDLRQLRGTPTQFLFLDADCAHCRAILTQLNALPLANAGLALIVISETDALRQQLPAEATLLIDPGWSTMPVFGLRGTPAAVRFDADGVMTQAAVHGTTAVRNALSQNFSQEVRYEYAPV
jgi:hypothetical protein